MQRPVQISATVLAVAAVSLFLAIGPFGQRTLVRVRRRPESDRGDKVDDLSMFHF